jgi:hypothetical protein
MSLSKRLEQDLVLPVQAERLGDLALAHGRAAAFDEFEDLLPRGHTGAGVSGHRPRYPAYRQKRITN